IVESPNEQPTEINIGTAHFSAKRLEQNQLVISHAEQSINKLGQYFGSDVLQQLEIDNIHGALIQFMKSIRYVTNATMSLEEVTTSRKLLESIKPARDLISARKLENLILSRKVEKGSQQKVRLEINGEITGKAKVNMNGSAIELTEADIGNIVLTNDPKSNIVEIEPKK
ncbi:MAG: hypothetical protein OEM52_14550, partial [bacterium]|nr:hypothetical protein [bacterium]